MYPINPVKNIIPQILLITDSAINPNLLTSTDLGEYVPISLVNNGDFIPGNYTLIIDDRNTSFEISKDGSFKTNSKNFISDKYITGTWWINGSLIIFEGTQEDGGDIYQLEFNNLNRELIKVIRNGENIPVSDDLESVYLIYDVIQKTHLLPYNFKDPILVNIKGEGGMVLSTKISLIIKCINNVDTVGLQQKLNPYNDFLVDICRLYLAGIDEDDLNLELIHKDELRKKLNIKFNEILNNLIDLRKTLMLNPIQQVLFTSYIYQ